MTPLGANVDSAGQSLPAGVPTGRRGLGTREDVGALAARTMADFAEGTRRTRNRVTDDVADVMTALKGPPALLVAVPDRCGTL